jgi:hypothetical protein
MVSSAPLVLMDLETDQGLFQRRFQFFRRRRSKSIPSAVEIALSRVSSATRKAADEAYRRGGSFTLP